MRKARITRQVVRRTLAEGIKAFDGTRGREAYWTSTLKIENKAYEVSWVQKQGYILVVSVYRLGEYD
jgi:hypothetical protein